MKNYLIFFVCFVLIITVNLFSKEYIKTIDSKNITSMNLNLKTGGSIIITGKKNQKQIYIKILSNISILDKDASIIKDKNVLEFVLKNSSSDNLRVKHIEIITPYKFNLNLKTIGGDIYVTNLNGKISGKTLGGDIKLSHLNGSAKFKTSGGNIKLKNSTLKGKLTTMGGNIVFDDISGSIEGKSFGGNIVYKNMKNNLIKGKNKPIRIDTMGGDIDINKAPFGAEVKTLGGDIDIRFAKYFVKAKTNGGNIIIHSMQGSSEAITNGGNIKVYIDKVSEIKNYKTKLISMGGDIILYVPGNLSTQIDAQILVKSSKGKKYKIISDFKLNINQTDKLEKKDGLTYKEIKGISNTRKGKNKIFLRTRNGNIFIKKT